MMKSGEKHTTHPRKRRTAPKVRTGCHTCKIRHLKCGEEKPICLRCANAKIKCDGYGPKPPRVTSSSVQVGNKSILSFPEYNSNPTASISSPLFRNENEFQYFNLFCTYTGHEILPLFGHESIRRALLQQCQINPAIRHALIAIGALDKTAESVKEFQELSLDHFTAGCKPNEHHTMAIKHYAKAVEYMRSEESDQTYDLRIKLLICLLVVCFEAWNGNHKMALRQANIGISIIHEWRSITPEKEESIDVLQSENSVVKDELILFFGRLAMQISILLSDQAVSCRQLLEFKLQKKDIIRMKQDTFKNMREATDCYQDIIRRSVYLTSPYNYSQPKVGFLSFDSITEQRILESEIRHWLSAFNNLYKNLKLPSELRFAKLLKVHLLTCLTGVMGIFSNDHMIWDNFTVEWDEILNLSEELIHNRSSSSKLRRTKFCFDSRVVVPLWLLGLRCRDPGKRRKAVNLMIGWPRREGLWDSLFTGKALEWVIETEERFMKNKSIPSWARIENLEWDSSDLQHRRAILSCHQKFSPDSISVIRTKQISW